MNLPLARPGARKEAILSLVPQCRLGAEIGADPGLISAHLLRENRCGHMVVSDISAASLAKARRLFLLHGLTARAALRVADGLDALCGLAEKPAAVVIAGMGAQSIAGILARGSEAWDGTAFVLQPNPDPPYLRRWLAAHGFAIEAERLAFEGGRYYVAMRARRGASDYTPKELLLGPCLLRDKPALWQPYLRWRRDCLRAARDTGPQTAWIEEEMADEAGDGPDRL